ncbi:hypothetical protein FA95DRAFT_1413144 [Auriscalpium vulgare]|uniref:Uncharacterized protein n=1 Tax=Auriscalpium vulgare TaxID=40419 RepID=A0ACB8RQE7_9AGAM|nr:hypothetical protein FA95DRAFT_1413144 [Auriscalpium vulgare]
MAECESPVFGLGFPTNLRCARLRCVRRRPHANRSGPGHSDKGEQFVAPVRLRALTDSETATTSRRPRAQHASLGEPDAWTRLARGVSSLARGASISSPSSLQNTFKTRVKVVILLILTAPLVVSITRTAVDTPGHYIVN